MYSSTVLAAIFMRSPEPSVQQFFAVVTHGGTGVLVHDVATCRFTHGLTRRRVPLHGGGESRIGIRRALGDHANFSELPLLIKFTSPCSARAFST